jgi:uncharacterized membrane protein
MRDRVAHRIRESSGVNRDHIMANHTAAISYAVSYLFIAIIWINHHYLMRFVGPPTLRLIWINFVHLFMVSLLTFATAWIAAPDSRRPL